MKILKVSISTAAVLAAFLAAHAETQVERIFRRAHNTRGNTNIVRVQPIDEAAWLWHPSAREYIDGTTDFRSQKRHDTNLVLLKFRKEFEVVKDGDSFEIDVSADERFVLLLDGKFIARGPNRGTVENWQYQSYVIRNLKAGKHLFEVYVQRIGNNAPLAQLSYRGGFILKASGSYDPLLTTGKTPWQVGCIEGVHSIGSGDAWGTGSQFEIRGAGPYSTEPANWVNASIARGGTGRAWGLRTPGWMLFPTQIPDQIQVRTIPGRIKAVSKNAPFRGAHVFTKEEAAETIDLSKPFTVPANTRLQLAWDFGRYYCAYPDVTISGGKDARISMRFSESSRDGKTHRKLSVEGARDLIEGRYLAGFGDVFVSDGRKGANFSSLWFRCGKWCCVDIETKDEPLTVDSLAIIETRYPLELESSFSTPDDSTIPSIRRIAARAMQMCCHEMLFDCPYYEQQMYPGDTRVQLNVISAMTRDDRIIKRAIEIYDLNTRDDGMCPFNFPTRNYQEGASYTLCYLLMYGDYVMNHTDREWLRARLPGMRKSMAGIEYYENKDGLLENLPGWNFLDWVVGWSHEGITTGCRSGDGVNSQLNLFWFLAMRSAAQVERALGNELQAKYWDEKCEKLKVQIVEKFWDEKRGLLADSPHRWGFSEHSQALAIVGDVLPKDKADIAFANLIKEPHLRRCTVYFSYYLFEAYFKYGRGDLFLKRLDLWRDYVKKGLTTTQESPDNGGSECRSDCHAWGAHPIWFMQTGLAGIKSAAPFFEKLLVSPCPGGLKSLEAKHPHPKGWIEVNLKFDGAKAFGTIKTPIPGTFKFGDQTFKLKAGENTF